MKAIANTVEAPSGSSPPPLARDSYHPTPGVAAPSLRPPSGRELPPILTFTMNRRAPRAGSVAVPDSGLAGLGLGLEAA